MHIPRLLILASLLAALPIAAQVPNLINYQGRVAVGTVNFDGTGEFKFALVNTTGSTTYWSNDGTSTAGSQPTAAVTLGVTKGLYSVHLGDTGLANMTAIPASVFTNADVRLRVWFNDGVNGSQLLTPDHRIAAVGYAMMADTASAANGLKTTGADVVVSAAAPPTSGQILTASSATTASWQTHSTPKCDRQFILGSNTSTNSTQYADITGASLTTHNLGETGTYLINCRSSVSNFSSNAVQVILNINGTDITASEVNVQSGLNSTTASITYAAGNIGTGTVIKVRFKAAGGGTTSCSGTQLTIDGVPSTYVQ